MQNQNSPLPFDYCHRWIRAAFNMVEPHFSLLALLGLVVFTTEAMVSFVPFLGSVANPVLRFIYTFGGLRLMDALMQNQTHTIESYFKLSFDDTLVKPFQNYLIACAALGFITMVGMLTNLPHFYWVTLVASLGLYFIPFMAFYQFRHPGTTERQAMDHVLSQVWKNIGNLLCLTIFMLALGAVAMALCVVPFFLYYMPLTFPLAYLVYMGLCENKTIEELHQTWNSRGDSTVVQ